MNMSDRDMPTTGWVDGVRKGCKDGVLQFKIHIILALIEHLDEKQVPTARDWMFVVPKDLKDKAMMAESMELFLAAMKVYLLEIEFDVGLEIF